MTLSDVQTKRLKKIPIILVGKDWTDAVAPYLQYMKTTGGRSVTINTNFAKPLTYQLPLSVRFGLEMSF